MRCARGPLKLLGVLLKGEVTDALHRILPRGYRLVLQKWVEVVTRNSRMAVRIDGSARCQYAEGYRARDTGWIIIAGDVLVSAERQAQSTHAQT